MKTTFELDILQVGWLIVFLISESLVVKIIAGIIILMCTIMTIMEYIDEYKCKNNDEQKKQIQ